MMYLVSYSRGEYECYHVNPVFVTNDKSVAEAWVTKFNQMVDRWRNYYRQFEDESPPDLGYYRDNHRDKYDRWYKLLEMGEAFFTKIEER